MPDMSWQTSGYRYGFSGHENDNDVKGEGNSVNYKFRMLYPSGEDFSVYKSYGQSNLKDY